MPKYNNKFAWGTFNEEVKELHSNVRCLSFQGYDALLSILQNGVYRASDVPALRTEYSGYLKELGFVPIWNFNPLQFGDHVQTTWDIEWFADASLWRRFIEFAGFESDTICQRVLLEFDVHSDELQRDVVHDYGFCSICESITKEDLIGAYRLQYPDDDIPDWFYPTIYPFTINKPEATFKEIRKFCDKD